MSPRLVAVAGGSALLGWLACAPPKPPPPAPPATALGSSAAAVVTEAPARPAPEVPAIPEAEAGQRELLAAIDEDCDVLGVYHRHPPDLGSTKCLEQLAVCAPRMHALGLLAHSPHPEVRGRALASAARMHNIHRCSAEGAHPCAVDRSRSVLADSELCTHLGWVPGALAGALSHPELAVRRGAAEGLVNTVVPADVLVPAVRDLLRRYEPGPEGAELTDLVAVVLMALRVAGEQASGLVPELDGLLAQRDVHDERVVVGALHVVQTLGDAALVLKPGVIEALGDRRSGVRLAAVEVLGRIGEKEDAPRLSPLLNDRDATVRQVARAMRQRLTSDFRGRHMLGF